METKEYKYDVAFSFCETDENIAADINGLVQERIKTFFYSKGHEEIQASEGEKTFHAIFGKDARIVFVLYRKEWGTTPWTRSQETAIRNRAFEDGFDFTIFAPLDQSHIPPKWLPKTRMWYGLERWGIEGAASVIEARVQEFGGKVREQTIEDHVTKLSKSLEIEKEKQSLLNSERGVNMANKEISILFAEIEKGIEKISEIDKKANFMVEKKERRLAVIGENFTIQLFWTASFSNTLKSSALYLTLFKGRLSVEGKEYFPFEKAERLKVTEFNFDTNLSGTPLWTEVTGKKRYYLTSDLAKSAIALLFEHVHKT